MKKIQPFLFLVMCCLATACTSHTVPAVISSKHFCRINNVHTDHDVAILVARLSNKDTIAENLVNFPDSNFLRPDIVKAFNMMHLAHFYKADIDNNGYDDLVINGVKNNDTYTICITDSGNDRLALNYVRLWRMDGYCFAQPVRADGQWILNVYRTKPFEEFLKDSTCRWKKVQLKYMFGAFIEYNPLPAKHKIEKVAYSTTYCFGSCPVFTLSISPDLSVTYNAQHFNKPDGYFTGAIDAPVYDTIVKVLNYLDFPKLEDHYRADWTDDQTSTLTITYDGGRVKKIEDYALVGTYGLKYLYNILFRLRTTQHWQKEEG